MRKLRKLLSAVLAVVFVGSVGMVLWNILQYSAGQQTYDQAQQIAFQEPAPETITGPLAEVPEQTVPLSPGAESQQASSLPMDEAALFLREVNVLGLRQVNPDVLGWIYIPDTNISYPLMQTDDRDEYLEKA